MNSEVEWTSIIESRRRALCSHDSLSEREVSALELLTHEALVVSVRLMRFDELQHVLPLRTKCTVIFTTNKTCNTRCWYFSNARTPWNVPATFVACRLRRCVPLCAHVNGNVFLLHSKLMYFSLTSNSGIFQNTTDPSLNKKRQTN